MTVRVAINGFGRTGRAALRCAMEAANRDRVQVVAVNDLADPLSLARLLARDSVHGPFPGPVVAQGGTVAVDGCEIHFVAEAHPESLPWRELGIDVVIESTGHMIGRDQAQAHLAAGARRVVISAPSKDADATFVLGVNDATFDPVHHVVVSNASCTTNCLAMLVKVLDDAFTVEEGLMSTVHGYTGDQHLTDSLHQDPRRGRAAAINIVPTTTGAARTTGKVIPSVAGHLDGLAMRVPVPDGSMTDLVAIVAEPVTVEAVNQAFADAAMGALAGYLEYSEEPLVSTDILGSHASCVFDAPLTMVSGPLVKVLGWYDNEMGYSSRLVELAAMVGAVG